MRDRVVGSIGVSRDAVNERLLTARDAADILGMSESWLRGSDVPFVRLGRARRYRHKDLIAYAEARLSQRSLREEM
jgi:hypothetical protein